MSKAVTAVWHSRTVVGLVHHRFDIVDVLAHFLSHFLHHTGDAPRIILINPSGGSLDLTVIRVELPRTWERQIEIGDAPSASRRNVDRWPRWDCVDSIPRPRIFGDNPDKRTHKSALINLPAAPATVGR